MQNMTYDNKHMAIGYQPLLFGQPVANQFATLFVVFSHQAIYEIGSLMQQQASFSISIYVIILLLASGLALIILSWNKKLKEMVDKKTKELQKANNDLQKANEQLKVMTKYRKTLLILQLMN